MVRHAPPARQRVATHRFARWEHDAVASLDGLYPDADPGAEALHRRQAAALGRVSAAEALDELAAVGLLSERMARQAAESVAADVDRDADTADD